MPVRADWRQFWSGVVTLGTILAACDPIEFAAIQVAPQAVASPDSATQRALSLVARIAGRRGLVPVVDTHKDPMRWNECLGRSTLFVCGKVHAGEAQFQMRQWHSFSADALSLKRELLDSLRVEFGHSRVQECKWTDKRDLPSSGCEPLKTGGPDG